MAGPEFAKSVVETLAKRARHQCSNPDCGVHTIAASSDPEKATSIGEAAHVHGAHFGSARYLSDMTDIARSSITNGIWLCRNCHRKVDLDEALYPHDLLFAWREAHEVFVLSQLGTRGELLRDKVLKSRLAFLDKYPQLIQRIAYDKPAGWEWMFAAGLLRHLNKEEFRKLDDMRAGHYYRAYPAVKDRDFLNWITNRTIIMGKLIGPYAPLMERLTLSFGPPGQAGDLEEIFHVCILLHRMLSEMVAHEEIMRFTPLPDNAEELRGMLMDTIGTNAEGLNELPTILDKVVEISSTDHGGSIENPTVIEWKLPFTLSDGLNENFEGALDRYATSFISMVNAEI